MGSTSGRVKPKTIQLICVASSLRTLFYVGRKSKDWLARNQDNVSEWGAISIRGLLFQ